MKRIEFIAPVEAMRGNLSGKQELQYPLNDQGAYEAPEGKHYATNYQPRFIGAKRASDNLKYFAVRTKNAVKLTAASRKAMAVMGATGAIIGAILADKSSALYTALIHAFEVTKPSKDGKPSTFREWLSAFTMGALRGKYAEIKILWNNEGSAAFLNINNPFVSGGTAEYDVEISDDVLVKFWGELANNPINFTVAGQKGIAHSGDTFEALMTKRYNVLGLSSVSNITVGEETLTSAIAFGETEGNTVQVLKSEDTYPDSASEIAAVEYELVVGETSQG